MTSRPPSLKALRTFEAAARLGSLTHAARELNVTVPAVAFQVRQVEDALGRRLLLRNGRNLEASPDGALLAGELAAAFGSIIKAVDRARADSASPGVVTISVLPSFLRLWLLPRLGQLRALCPELDVRVSTSERHVDFAQERVDCSVRCGKGEWDGVTAEVLFPQLLAPVCHASFVQKCGLSALRDLPDELLITNTARPGDWSAWFQSNGLDRGEPKTSQRVEGRELVVDALAAGLGIGLADVSLLRQEVDAGKYVRFGSPWNTGWSHYLVIPQGVRPTPDRVRFTQWLMTEARGNS